MINKERLKQVLADQYDTILNKNFGIRRNALDEISEKIKLPHIHIITGLRRSGKSVFLRQIINRYYSDKNFYYINFEDERLFNFPAYEFNIIYEALLELFGKQTVFFIDEIQNVKNFETFVGRFYEQGFKFFITGSNADLLSSEIATKLTGRHIDTYISPFDFKEFLLFKKYKFNKNEIYLTENRVKIKMLFNEYLTTGGMPEYLMYYDNEILTRTYNDIVLKDIVVRYKLENLFNVKLLYNYMLANYCRKYSYNSLRKIINIGSSNTVINYLHYLEQTFFLKQITKFDYSVKKQIANEKKAYIIDNGFINTLSPVLTKDKGWLLENLIFNELFKKNEVYYFSGKNECDFITINNSQINKLYQITNNLNKENRDREINGLIEAMKFFKITESTIITYDTEEKITTNNNLTLNIIPVWKWLLNQ